MITHRNLPRAFYSASCLAAMLAPALLGISGCSPDREPEPAVVEPALPVVLGTTERGIGVKAIEVKGLIDDARYDEAETLLQSLLAERPGDPALTSDLAVVYQKTGRSSEALRLLQEGLERDPDYPLYHLRIGRSYADQKEFEQAVEHLDRAIEINPALAEAHELRGKCLMLLNRVREARKAFETALANDPRLPPSLVYMALFEADTGQWDSAIDYASRAIAIDPEISRAHVLLGWALAERGEFPEAERALERAAELEPNNPQIPAIRARVAQMRSAAQ